MGRWIRACTLTAVAVVTSLIGTSPFLVSAQSKPDKVVAASVVDSEGLETEIKNLFFYWEEKISENAFVPHELRHVPVKRGSATVNVKFENIKEIVVKPDQDSSLPVLAITLTNDKVGEFTLSINGKFKGQSDFGEIEVPANGIKRIIFR